MSAIDWDAWISDVRAMAEPRVREHLERFLEHLHETGALSCPPGPEWVSAFLERDR